MTREQDPAQLLKNLEEAISKVSIQPESGGKYTAAQLDEMAKELRKQVDELKVKADEIQKRTGMTREELDAYTNNPDNFSNEEWEAICRIRESIDRFKQQVWAAGRTGADKRPSPQSAAAKEGKSRRDHWRPA
jgi:uncharacterized coiled-coil DUF342 family protein